MVNSAAHCTKRILEVYQVVAKFSLRSVVPGPSEQNGQSERLGLFKKAKESITNRSTSSSSYNE